MGDIIPSMLPLCECPADGYCPRYRRLMTGRFREICAGINCDLGTAAAFREQWSRESIGLPQGDTRVVRDGPIPLILRTDQAPGDAVVMTAAIYSLHRAYPGHFLTAVESPYPDVFAYNPDVTSVKDGAAVCHMHYPAIHRCNTRGIHFMQGWCEHLGNALSVPLPLLTNRPHLYFAVGDREDFFGVQGKWLVCSGGKSDFTNKLWGHHNYQEVINRLQGYVRFIQVGANEADHPSLSGVDNMVGRTSLRGLFDMCRRASGVLCGVSLLMHVAAALDKPAVVIAGGREPVQWNAYPRQQYVHTVGALPCVSTQGQTGVACWRGRVLPLNDGSMLDYSPCQRPVNGTPTKLTRVTIPECMAMIRPDHVAELVLRYHHAGIKEDRTREAEVRR